MTTTHEAVADRFMERLRTAAFESATREDELPRECPDDGVVNAVFADPKELDRTLGTGKRDISRIVNIEIVVKGADGETRRSRMDEILKAIGLAFYQNPPAIVGVDYLDIGMPIETDTVPMQGAALLRGTTVPIELLYTTSSNPMEAANVL